MLHQILGKLPKKLLKVLCCLMLSVLGSAPSYAATEGAANATSESTTEQKAEKPLSISLSYSIGTDLAEEYAPRKYSHSVYAAGAYTFSGDWVVGLMGSLSYESLGTDILTDEQADAKIDPSVRVGGGKKWSLGQYMAAEHSLRASAFSAFSLSDEARYEGVYAIPGVSLALTSAFFDGVYKVTNSVGAEYVVNRFDYSPVSGEINTRNKYSYRMSHSVDIWGGLSAGANFTFVYLEKLDGTSNYNFSNGQQLSYAYENWSLSVSHRNGGYTEFGDVDFWYIDKYRRLVSAEISVKF